MRPTDYRFLKDRQAEAARARKLNRYPTRCVTCGRPLPTGEGCAYKSDNGGWAYVCNVSSYERECAREWANAGYPHGRPLSTFNRG